MTQQTEVKPGPDWATFIRSHKVAFAAFVAAVILAVVGAV